MPASKASAACSVEVLSNISETVLFLLINAYYFTEGFADVATSYDSQPFFLILRAKFDPIFEISLANLPQRSSFHSLQFDALYLT